MARKTKRDWLIEGASMLAEQGAAALTIDAMTARMDVTKGSFYHHFPSQQDFKMQLLDFFENESTLVVIDQLEKFNSPTEKLAQLLNITSADPPTLEIAFRAWAMQDADVREYQARVDARRLAYLEQLTREILADERRAKRMAALLYSIYIGSQHIIPAIQQDDLKALYYEFQRLYQLP